MSDKNRRTTILASGAITLVVVASYVLFFRKDEPAIPESSGNTIYYTGPMKSKGGGGGYGTIDGKSMTAAEGEAAVKEWLKTHPELDTARGASAPPSALDQNQVN
jgi:hypothetical protein